MKSQAITSLTLDAGKQVMVAETPQNIQDLVEMYNDWIAEADKLRSKYAMTQAACKELVRELTQAVQQWQNPTKPEDAPAPSVASAPKPVAKKRKR